MAATEERSRRVGRGKTAAHIGGRGRASTPLGPAGRRPERLRGTVEAAPARGTPTLALPGRDHIEVHDACRAVTSDQRPAPLGRPRRDAWPEARTMTAAPVEQVRAGGRTTLDFRIRRLSDERIVWIGGTDVPIEGLDGAVQEAGGAGHDVTAETATRRQAREACGAAVTTRRGSSPILPHRGGRSTVAGAAVAGRVASRRGAPCRTVRDAPPPRLSPSPGARSRSRAGGDALSFGRGRGGRKENGGG